MRTAGCGESSLHRPVKGEKEVSATAPERLSCRPMARFSPSRPEEMRARRCLLVSLIRP